MPNKFVYKKPAPAPAPAPTPALLNITINGKPVQMPTWLTTLGPAPPKEIALAQIREALKKSTP